MKEAELVGKTFLFLLVLVALLGVIGSVLVPVPTIPRCQEDEIIIGKGDFNGRYWESYACVAADDFEGKGF